MGRLDAVNAMIGLAPPKVSGQVTGRFAGLDALRLCAALLVVVYHLSYVEWLSPHSLAAASLPREAPLPWALPLTWCGWVGVQVFFLISGFVIAYSAASSRAAEFARNRFLRLWPAMLVCSLLSAPFYLAVGPAEATDVLTRLAKEILFVPVGPWMNGVVWTLGIEISFYALVFLLLMGRRLEWLGRVAGALAWGSLAYQGVLRAGVSTQMPVLGWLPWMAEAHPRLAQLLLLDHGCFFAAGVALYQMSQRKDRRMAWPVMLPAVVAGALQITRTAQWELSEYAGFGVDTAHFPSWLPLALWASALLCMQRMAWRRHPADAPRSAARTARFKRMGLLTYPLYLVHGWAGASLLMSSEHWGLPPALSVMLAIAGAFLLAALISQHLEPAARAHLRRIMDAGSLPAPLAADRRGSTTPGASDAS